MPNEFQGTRPTSSHRRSEDALASHSEIATPHILSPDRLTELLGVDPSIGLDANAIRERLERFGGNRLEKPAKKPLLMRFLAQFRSPLVLTLLGASAVALGLGASSSSAGESALARYGDAVAIVLIVLMNAVLGLAQEGRAEAALDALEKLESPRARALRAGQVTVVASEELVPGDILELEAGDAVAADARLLESTELTVDEAVLTGESTTVSKDAHAELSAAVPLAERTNMVFIGTTVVRGRGKAVVVATGPNTELGKIGSLVSSAGNEATPLEQRLESFGRRILWVCLGVSGVLFAWGMARAVRPWPVLLLEAVSFAVAAIPEGLPAITTITLALGMQRMAKKGAIVRRLPAVETLGAATVICTDKTGTLTQNEMTVREIYAGDRRYRVTGQGYEPVGSVENEECSHIIELPLPLEELIVTAALCNDAALQLDKPSGTYRVVGDPTEGALLTLACKAGHPREKLLAVHKIEREIPFDSDRKRMTVLARDALGSLVAHVKGGVETVLPRCTHIHGAADLRPMTETEIVRVHAECERLSAAGLRVLAIARRNVTDEGDPEQNLVFLGLVGMMDPPRAGVREAIQACARAGIRAVMITGDHPSTATAIARELGLWTPGDEKLTGPDLDGMLDEDLKQRIRRVRVFARATPEQKLRIVRAFKSAGDIVAMTGDGVNDAPALKEAHIGVAMGRSGTDVARQAAAIVITDDNFATIVEAVAEGRAIYENIQKFIFFLLSSNAGLAVAVFVTSFSGRWLTLTPLMILWINLVTNGLPALALGMDVANAEQMARPPRARLSSLVGRREVLGLAYVGVVMGLAAISLYVFNYCEHSAGPQGPRTMVFTVLALSPLFHAWSCRSSTESLFRAKPLVFVPLLVVTLISAGIQLLAITIPVLWPVFRTDALTPHDWMMVLIASALVVPAVEIAKAIARRWARATTNVNRA